MKKILLSILIISLINISICGIDLTTYYKDFIQNNGYKLEVHEVTTNDGYILSLWHLVPKTTTKKVAYFQHGLTDTAWCFFQLGSKSLPFLLMKEGFDVWLGNSRGNVFSAKHRSKDPTDPKSGFYDFTMEEKVKYDLPATFKYIQSKTNNKKMSYIAHSQGSTIFFMLYMTNRELVESSIDHLVTLGTVFNIAHAVFSPIKVLDTFYGILRKVNMDKGFLTLSNKQRLTISAFCQKLPIICKGFFENGASIKPTGRINYKNLYNYLYYYPGGTSNSNLLHWSQIHTLKKLVHYNPNFNKEKTATAYNTNSLKKWKVKALIARTDMDTLSSYRDVSDLIDLVNNDSILKVLELKNYGHLDVLAADSAYEDIFIPVIKFLKE